MIEVGVKRVRLVSKPVPVSRYSADSFDIGRLPGWLKAILLWVFDRFGAERLPQEEIQCVAEYSELDLSDPDFLRVIHGAIAASRQYLPNRPDCILIGQEEMHRLYATQVEIQGELTTVAGVKVVVVPWMTGILPLSLRQLSIESEA